MNVGFHTLGCKVNQYETQAMRELLQKRGYTTNEYTVGAPDVGENAIVINSCTVTGESDRKVRQLLNRCRRDNPQAILVLTGCLPQAFPAVAETLTQADIVLGNASRRLLADCLDEYRQNGQRIVRIFPHGKEYEDIPIKEFEGRTRAFVKIEDGCNRFCSYCIIPYARGRVRSRSLESLHDEITRLAVCGYREIVLTGINLTAYGQDCGLSICDAVSCAASVEGICRVRLGSIEPDHMTPAVIRRLSKEPKLCRQFHLALQSGCDATLRRMNRHYDTADYRRVCEQFREAFPGCALTTDVMVGFPGETEEEFETSLAFVKEIGFARLHCFPYSRRAGTPADKAKDQVPQEEKLCRNRRMIEEGNKGAAAFAETLVGTTQQVLIETKRDNGMAQGYTDTYIPVCVPDAKEGTLAAVQILKQRAGTCFGVIV